MSLVLVDTSVWIDFLRLGSAPSWRPILAQLLTLDRVMVVDPVISELLVGARGARERSVILGIAEGAQRAPIDLATWVAAGDLGRVWRERGRTLGVVDCLLATVAVREGVALWSLDRDFAPLFETGEVPAFQP